MRRRLGLVVFCIAASAACLTAEEPPSPGSTVLVEDAGQWDGRTVAFTGEAVGEMMRRGTMAWIHLNDDAYGLGDAGGLSGFNSGIGVWIDAGLASRIGIFGGYGSHGDVVEVTGTFNAACPQHGGDMDIHAEVMQIPEKGRPIPHPVSPARLRAAAVLAFMAAVLFAALLALRRRRRRHTGMIQSEREGNDPP